MGRDRAAISDAHGARRGMIWIVKRSGISVRPKSRQAPFEKGAANGIPAHPR